MYSKFYSIPNHCIEIEIKIHRKMLFSKKNQHTEKNQVKTTQYT